MELQKNINEWKKNIDKKVVHNKKSFLNQIV